MPESEAGRPVRLTIEGGVAELVLDRPDKLNAMSAAMVRELIESLDAAEAGGARAVLVRGEGRAFCSGRDLADADPAHEDGEAILRDEFNPLMARMAGLAVPTIAAVHGACLGTGLGLASPATSCTPPTTPGSVRRSRASARSWTAARMRPWCPASGRTAPSS